MADEMADAIKILRDGLSGKSQPRLSRPDLTYAIEQLYDSSCCLTSVLVDRLTDLLYHLEKAHAPDQTFDAPWHHQPSCGVDWPQDKPPKYNKRFPLPR